MRLAVALISALVLGAAPYPWDDFENLPSAQMDALTYIAERAREAEVER